MFYLILAALYIVDVFYKTHSFILNSSFSLRNLAINALIFFQTLIDFLWKSVDAQKEACTIIVNKNIIVSKENNSPIEKIYTFSVKELHNDVVGVPENDGI
jgi:hypothetical protein